MLTTTLLPEKCMLVIEETIPRGMYVDPDEMRDLHEGVGLRSHIPTKVDVEKPDFESEPFRVFIFRPLTIQENLRVTTIEIPVHLRYHKPREPSPLEVKRGDSPVAIVKLQNPRLFLSCEGENLAQLCPERAVTSFCDSSGTDKCEYLNVPYKINVNAVEVSVPVGNKDHITQVVALTTLIVSGGTIYLIISLFRKDKSKED